MSDKNTSKPLPHQYFEKGGVNGKPPANTKPQTPPPTLKKSNS